MSKVPPGRVGAVVLNWNGIEDTRRCVRGLLDQPGVESIVLVDNGSEGSEGETLLEEFATEERVRVELLPENTGFAAGVNTGVRLVLESGVTHILLLNNDATLEPGATETLVEALRQDSQAAAAGPRIMRDDSTGRVWFGGGRVGPRTMAAVHVEDGGTRESDQSALRQTQFLTFGAVLVRAEDWRTVGSLEERFFAYWEDVDWSLRATDAGRTLLHCPAAVARHRVSGSAGPGSPFQAYLLGRGHVLLASRRLRGAVRVFCFWPWMLLLHAPRVFLGSLRRGRPGTGAAFVRGVLRGALGGPPRGLHTLSRR